MSDATCYLERSKVRELLIAQPDENLHITEAVLHDIDQLPILNASDIAARQGPVDQALEDKIALAFNNELCRQIDAREKTDSLSVTSKLVALPAMQTLLRAPAQGAIPSRAPEACDCGFSAETCALNPCQRKKVHLAGLTPNSKWPNTGSAAVSCAAREAIAGAFVAGADAVHAEWVAAHDRGEGPPRGDPSFGEAARDYALSLPAAGGEASKREAEIVERCANIAYRVCAETRHVTLGDEAARAIRASLRKDG